ncbi:hypothetical protein [Kitasatospora acidiphila]|uniref:hypothetical protein n=1 Tax=Kitasatospora acidiphila TaxID=2567942 RepID=UPI003C780624
MAQPLALLLAGQHQLLAAALQFLGEAQRGDRGCRLVDQEAQHHAVLPVEQRLPGAGSGVQFADLRALEGDREDLGARPGLPEGGQFARPATGRHRDPGARQARLPTAVGSVGLDGVRHLARRLRLAHDQHAGVALQGGPQTRAEERVVVDEQHPDDAARVLLVRLLFFVRPFHIRTPSVTK